VEKLADGIKDIGNFVESIEKTNKPAGTECSDRGGKGRRRGKIHGRDKFVGESMEIMRKVSAEQSEAVNQTDNALCKSGG